MSEPNQPQHHPFEDYPRRMLKSGITRRQLLGAILTELQVSGLSKEAHPSARINDLGCLADDELKSFIPQILRGTRITIKDSAIWGEPPGFTRPVRMFTFETPTNFVFNLMNGENSLEQISYQMAIHLGWPSPRAFAFTRGLFLTLMDLSVAAPKNPPLE